MQTTEEASAAERTAVYRLYDEDERLLYVGVASDPRVRFKQHGRDKSWRPRVTARVD
ncbi:GIY-YIG nuclease family protein [Streptomyces sp. B21-108]|uniref:GIY-YIG nuclease family protein n=1 Tax=Streptomyces sp. B21-108 TaxID=3039419 RepID=UPI002FEF7AF5